MSGPKTAGQLAEENRLLRIMLDSAIAQIAELSDLIGDDELAENDRDRCVEVPAGLLEQMRDAASVWAVKAELN